MCDQILDLISKTQFHPSQYCTELLFVFDHKLHLKSEICLFKLLIVIFIIHSRL